MRKLSDEEMEVYRAPFKNEGEDRRPTLTFPREIPVEGHPKVSGNLELRLGRAILWHFASLFLHLHYLTQK